MRTVANAGPKFSTRESWSRYTNAKIISITNPVMTAPPQNLDSLLLAVIPSFNWLSVLCIYTCGRRGKALGPEIGVAIGMIIAGLLIIWIFFCNAYCRLFAGFTFVFSRYTKPRYGD